MKNPPAFCSILIFALLISEPKNAISAGAADPVVSKWNWGGPSVVQIWSNGRAHWQMGTMTMDGQWTVVSRGGANRERKYDITWNSGQWIDSVTMSPDHQHLYGRNQVGIPVNGLRIGGDPAPEEASNSAGAQTESARKKTATGKSKPIESSTEENGETPVSAPASRAENLPVSEGIPKSATVVVAPGETNLEMGDIKVAYADGHSQMWTKGAFCGDPHVSSAGDVGWVRSAKRDDPYTHRTPDTLYLHLHSGKTKELKPNDPFIETWTFASDNSEVIIKSRGHHGPAAFIKYNLKTGHSDEYAGGPKMPKWAEPFAD